MVKRSDKAIATVENVKRVLTDKSYRDRAKRCRITIIASAKIMSEAKLSLAEYYHERTKYDPETLASKSQGLDWSKQPFPYKDYKIGTVYDLKPYLTEELASDRDGLLANRWRRLSRLLFCSYGLTARVPTISGETFYLRSAPSAGGLYPAEIYIISAGTPLLSAGIYNYQVRTHSLIHFWQDSNVWQGLQKA